MSKLGLHPQFITDASGRGTEAVLDIVEVKQLRASLSTQVAMAGPEKPDECADLMHAAGTALEFWDNPEDAAAWNNYPPM